MNQRRRTIPRQPKQETDIFSRPDFDMPELPNNLTDLSDDTLMYLFAAFTSWQNFAAVEQADAEVAEARAEAAQRYAEASAMVKGWGGTKDKVTVAKAELSQDPEVEAARQQVLTAYARRKLTQVVYANCERSVFVVSRELSRRIGNVGYERRSMRWNP